MDILIVGLLVVAIGLMVALLLRKAPTARDERLHDKVTKLEGSVETLVRRQDDVRKETSGNLEKIRDTVEVRVRSLQDDNSKKLEEMRVTVDEKLQASVEKRFAESFKSISGQLESVQKGLGEMQVLANDVGNLNRTLAGTKTKGVFGEVQLAQIIKDMLTPVQYEENFIVKAGTKDEVEFVIKLPDGPDGKPLYLPIDSKFLTTSYEALLEVYDRGEKEKIAVTRKALAADVQTQAKKIAEKYLDPPRTTNFGILFLPTESLYAEVMRIPGLADDAQKKYAVTIVGPSTLSAFISSLQMGFKTLAISERSDDVWKTLGAVKAQFGKFGDMLGAVKKKLEETTNKISDAEVRARAVERELKHVEELPEKESVKLIGKV
jgi:DNA recombination protein RmuC